jgi:plasmid maintenance system antidote protein VapI
MRFAFVNRKLEVLEVSLPNAARRLRLSRTEFAVHLEGRLAVMSALAERIARAFGGRAEFWLELQARFETHPKSRGRLRDGSERKRLGLQNKIVRVAAKPEEMPLIEAWLNAQDSAAQAVAQLILRQAKRPVRSGWLATSTAVGAPVVFRLQTRIPHRARSVRDCSATQGFT